MFDYDTTELREDLSKFLDDKGASLDEHSAVFNADEVRPPLMMAIAPSHEEAARAMRLFASCLSLVGGLVTSLRVHSEDGDQKEACLKVIAEIDEHIKKFTNWSNSDDPTMQYTRKVAEENGYQMSKFETDVLDFFKKWSTPFRQTIGYVHAIRPEYEGTFLSVLLQSGMGEIITLYGILMDEPVDYNSVVDANARMLEYIEDNAHSWMLANAATKNTMNRFATLLSRAEADHLNLYTSQENHEEALLQAAISTDISEDLVPVTPGMSRIHSNVVAGEGQTKAEALKNAIKQILERVKTDAPGRHLSALKVLNDDGKIVDIAEYFREIGEEVPQDVIDALNGD